MTENHERRPNRALNLIFIVLAYATGVVLTGSFVFQFELLEWPTSSWKMLHGPQSAEKSDSNAAKQESRSRKAASTTAPDSGASLVAPILISPQKLADLRHRKTIRFDWAVVPGASGYYIKAWQIRSNGKRTFLLDTQTDKTQIFVRPKYFDRKVFWKVAAVGANNHLGPYSQAVTIGLLLNQGNL